MYTCWYLIFVYLSYTPFSHCSSPVFCHSPLHPFLSLCLPILFFLLPAVYHLPVISFFPILHSSSLSLNHPLFPPPPSVNNQYSCCGLSLPSTKHQRQITDQINLACAKFNCTYVHICLSLHFDSLKFASIHVTSFRCTSPKWSSVHVQFMLVWLILVNLNSAHFTSV